MKTHRAVDLDRDRSPGAPFARMMDIGIHNRGNGAQR